MAKLDKALLNQIHDFRTGRNRYNNHEILDALVAFASTVIHNCADDHGAGLAALERQFIDRLHEAILASDHDEEFHDADKQH